MIGDGGGTLKGQHVHMRLPTGKYSAPWKIIGAQQKLGGWEYTISLRGLKQKTVSGDDDNWAITIPGQSPVEVQTAQYLVGRLADNVQGDVTKWAESEAGRVSKCIKMSDELTTDDDVRYLWSGGAADCVIVAGYSEAKSTAYLTHGTRASIGSAGEGATSVGDDAVVYLSSQYFGYPNAAEAKIVQEVVQGLQTLNANVAACYGSGWLAINGNTGEVFSKFAKPG